MTNESKERFLADQVRALATIVLTRRGDLTIVETKKDTGLDLHVFIERDDKPMRLMLGVLLRGVPGPIVPEQATNLLVPTVGQFQGMRKFTYPVCLLLFATRDEEAYFSWLAEPVVEDGAPKLLHHTKARVVALTDAYLDALVQQIVAWYDAVEVVLIS